ncbi:MAG: hypothetical protein LPJ95_09065 [Paracoccaceae bacterium]|nr:hypothetical protein [Paracoccaceae bacterium]
MPAPRLALANELADIRAEIARLKQRERALASIEHDFPVIPVFRRGWPIQRPASAPPPGPAQATGQVTA